VLNAENIRFFVTRVINLKSVFFFAERAFKGSHMELDPWLAAGRFRLRASWGSTGCTRARPSAGRCLPQRNPLVKGWADTIDSEYVGVGRGRRMDHSSRT